MSFALFEPSVIVEIINKASASCGARLEDLRPEVIRPDEAAKEMAKKERQDLHRVLGRLAEMKGLAAAAARVARSGEATFGLDTADYALLESYL